MVTAAWFRPNGSSSMVHAKWFQQHGSSITATSWSPSPVSNHVLHFVLNVRSEASWWCGRHGFMALPELLDLTMGIRGPVGSCGHIRHTVGIQLSHICHTTGIMVAHCWYTVGVTVGMRLDNILCFYCSKWFKDCWVNWVCVYSLCYGWLTIKLSFLHACSKYGA